MTPEPTPRDHEGGHDLLFIGLGRMGLPIARRLIQDGWDLRVWDVDAAALSAAQQLGARVAQPDDVAELRSRRTLLCLPDPPAVSALASLWTRAPPQDYPRIIADFTTVSPLFARTTSAALAHCGVAYLDTPLSGGDRGARTGELVLLSSGEREAFDAMRGIFDVVARTTRFVGAAGVASQMKAVNQFVYIAYNVAFAHGLRLARDMGLPEAETLELLMKGAPAHPLINERVDHAIANDYAAGFSLSRCLKDVACVEAPPDGDDDARNHLEAILRYLSHGVESGQGDLDVLALSAPQPKAR